MSRQNELRVFISSTFRDLQEEREHLVKKIFPEIRALCRQRGVTFTEIDLRWGLTEEEASLGRVIRTCLEEIDNCRPYFIGLVGERYGWAPELHEYYKDPALFSRWPWLEEGALHGASITDLEFRHGALNNPDEAGAARFFFRDLEVRPPADGPDMQIEELKSRIRASGLPIFSFDTPESLGHLVLRELHTILDRDFAEARPPTPREQQRADIEAFSASRRHAYIPNAELLRQLDTWYSTGTPPLIISGESGSGKSSLLAFWSDMTRRRNPDLQVIELYVGLGAGGSDHYRVMHTIMDEIRDRFDRSEEIPERPEDMEREFGNWLGFGLGASILLVVDGLDQLTGRGAELYWLPPALPPGVHLLLSTTPGPILDRLRDRSWHEVQVEPLGLPEREAVIVRFLAEYSKAVSTEQLRQITADPKAAHPLFLRTLLEELRLHGEHERLQDRIDHLLAATDTDDLFLRVLERLEADHSTTDVGEVLGLLAVARDGLDEEEVAEITDLSRMRLSSLLLGLDYHLLRRGSILSFFHGYLRRAVEKRYLDEQESGERFRHQVVDRVESILSDPSSVATSGIEELVRPARELLFQLERLGDDDRLSSALASIPVLMSIYRADTRDEYLGYWARLGDTHDIEEECRNAIDRWEQTEPDDVERMQVYGRIADLLSYATRWDSAVDFYRRRKEIAVELKDRSTEGDALAKIIELTRLRGDYSEALRLSEEFEQLGREVDDPTIRARSIGNRGVILSLKGHFDQALACFAEQEEIYRRIDDRNGIADVLRNLGIALSGARRFDEAIEQFEQEIRLARERGDRIMVARSTGNLGLCYFEKGDLDRALELYREQEMIARDIGDRRALGMVLSNRAMIDRRRGRLQEALNGLLEAESIYREIGDRSSLALVLGNLGHTYLATGDLEIALHHVEEQASIGREIREPRTLVIALGQAGNIRFAREEYSDAFDAYTEWRALALKLGDRRIEAMATGNLGLIESIRGNPEEAIALLQQAMAIHREVQDMLALRYWLFALADELLEVLELHCRRGILAPMPDYVVPLIEQHLDDPTEWRSAVVAAARELFSEFSTIGRDRSLSEDEFNVPLFTARLEAADGNLDTALDALEQMLREENEESEQAALQYRLFRLGHTYRAEPTAAQRERASEHRRAALDWYRSDRPPRNEEVARLIVELESEDGG